MGMRAVLAVMIACGCVSLVEARDERPFAKEWEIYRSFLTTPACGAAPKSAVDACIEALDYWKRDFMWATNPSWERLLEGQRNIAACLSTGCDGDVVPQPMLACAWSRVVLRSGHPTIQAEDVNREQRICGALDSDAERDTADAQATRLLSMLNVR